MTGASLADALITHGLDPAERELKEQLFDLVLERWRVLAPRASEGRAWWVPGRLEVFGKHTDYAGGRTLVSAVPRGFAVAASARRDGILQVIDALNDERMELSPDRGESFVGWRHYVRVVAARLARNFPGPPIGADIVFASDLPRASGMSSSSALMISMATALVHLARLDERDEWRANIQSPLDAAGYYACIENGRTFGTLDGDAGVGTHGGSEDHAAILTGQPSRLSAFEFVPMRPFGECGVPRDWRFVLAPCGVPSEKTGSAKEKYNRLSLGTSVLLECWNSHHGYTRIHTDRSGYTDGSRDTDGSGALSLGAALASDPNALRRLHEIVQRSSVPGWTPEALARRLDHFVREDARIPAALAAFDSADAARIADLASGSQADAETLLENQIPATSALAQRARELGAIGACSFGAGFGGSVWAIVEAADAEAFASRWTPRAFVARPGPSVTAL